MYGSLLLPGLFMSHPAAALRLRSYRHLAKIPILSVPVIVEAGGLVAWWPGGLVAPLRPCCAAHGLDILWLVHSANTR